MSQEENKNEFRAKEVKLRRNYFLKMSALIAVNIVDNLIPQGNVNRILGILANTYPLLILVKSFD